MPGRKNPLWKQLNGTWCSLDDLNGLFQPKYLNDSMKIKKSADICKLSLLSVSLLFPSLETMSLGRCTSYGISLIRTNESARKDCLAP